jgi:hypothetical protein
MNKRFTGTLLLVLLLISAASFTLWRSDPRFSFPVLMVANGLMFLLSLITFSMVQKTFRERPQAFVRGILSGTLIRLFACVFAVLIYALLNRQHLYKPELFVLLGIYALYSIVENTVLSRMAKGTK